MSTLATLFSGLDRLGPGSTESLRWALGIAGVERGARVLDAGCGTGADLGILTSLFSHEQVVAVDLEQTMIARVKSRFPKVEAHVADMTNPPGGPFDLIWAAGSIYCAGVIKALSAWRQHLTPHGAVAFSDLRARQEHVPDAVRDFWAGEGVELGSAAALEADVNAAGYQVLGARWVGPAGWASYYGPLESELDSFDQDPKLVAKLRAEIALWRTHGVTYGYRLIVAKPV